jgi:signal transduction histidine kinase
VRTVQLSLRSWLLLSHNLVLAIPVALLAVSGIARNELQRQTRSELFGRGPIVTRILSRDLAELRMRMPAATLADVAPDVLDLLAPLPDEPLPVVTWVFDERGEVVASSHGTPPFTAAGIPTALSGSSGATYIGLPNQSLRQRMTRVLVPNRVVVTLPVKTAYGVEGAVMLARQPRHPVQVAGQHKLPLYVMIFVASWVAIFLGFLIADRLGRSLDRLANATRRVADGDLHAAATMGTTDVSQVHEVSVLSQDIGRMASRIDARLRLFQELATHAAHEFRTPLSTLIGTVEILRDEPRLPPARRVRFLAQASDQLDRMRALIDGLLALARADGEPHREHIDLADLGVAVAERRDGVTYQGVSAPTIGDPVTLGQAIANLTDNALRHGAPPIVVRSWVDGDDVGVDVIDAGRGIPEDKLPRLFDRFFTTDRNSGVGLGLPLVAAVVEAHGGSVHVHSKPGRTRFRIRLPRGLAVRDAERQAS